jgi:hypothetical protein
MRLFIRALLVACGTLSVALGVLGMFLPVLPTTPFLLLAAVCYARGSERCYRWLLTNRWCGKYISNYRAGIGIPRKHKVLTLVLLWMTIGLTASLFVSQWWLRLLLVFIAAGVTVHIARIKTFKPEGGNPESGACPSASSFRPWTHK